MQTIFLLEDDRDIRELIQMILEEENYKVHAFSNVADFTNRDKSIPADLFLLDVMLPDGSGLDVCEQLSQVQKTPILIMSAHATLKDIESNCQASDFIQKPFDIENLLMQIRSRIAN